MRDLDLNEKIAVARKGLFNTESKRLERCVYAVSDVIFIKSLDVSGLIYWRRFRESLIELFRLRPHFLHLNSLLFLLDLLLQHLDHIFFLCLLIITYIHNT